MIRKLLRAVARLIVWVCTFVGFVIVSGALCLYLMNREHQPKSLAHDTVLTLTLEGSYVDHHTGLPGLSAIATGGQGSLYDVTRAIMHGAKDKKVVGLILRIETPSLSTAQIQEIRDALLVFQKEGKPAWCYTDSFGELGSGTGLYYLATACPHITVQPLGMVNLIGISMESPFAKGALDKLGVVPNLIQKKEYKSYEEIFTREDFSLPAREALQATVDSFLSQIVDGIAQARKLPPDHVRALIETGPYVLEAAKTSRLIDKIGFYDDLLADLKKNFDTSMDYMDVDAYLKTLPLDLPGEGIALIFGTGTIQREKSPVFGGEATIDTETLCTAFQDAADDPHVKAIVFRIDSPGGSPLASETIRHALEQVKKPIIISMGSAAASGGYWIALPGSQIVAQPATLTGSIGAMGGKFVLAGLFEKLGIHWGRVSTHENATLGSFSDPYTPLQQAQVDLWIQQIYDAFVSRVSKSRHMTPEQVEKVARGRVWTGEQAFALGLVDHLGGLHTAIGMAQKVAGLPMDAPLHLFPKPRSLLETLAEVVSGAHEASLLAPQIRILMEGCQFLHQVRAYFPSSQATVSMPFKEIHAL